MPMDAGKGEHRSYVIRQQGTDQQPLAPGSHYLGVDAVAWYLRKESSWFTDRTASGVLEIVLAGGLEKYAAALGTFELKGGALTAPIFEKPVLPDRAYRGGPITLSTSIFAMAKDTALMGMLKSAASASLSIVAGSIQTATLAGPALALSAAGGEIVGGVKTMLASSAPKREPVFDAGGFEVSIQPGDIVGPQAYVLLHRGDKLDVSQLSVRRGAGSLLLPFHKTEILQDGAWLLLRLRRSVDYSGVRDWFDAARKLRAELAALVEDVQAGVTTKQDALARLQPTTTGTTLWDEYTRLRSIIASDGVLTEAQAKTYVADLFTRVKAARDAITAERAESFHAALGELHDAFVDGVQPPRRLRADIASAFGYVSQQRQAFRVGEPAAGADELGPVRQQRAAHVELGFASMAALPGEAAVEADVAREIPARVLSSQFVPEAGGDGRAAAAPPR